MDDRARWHSRCMSQEKSNSYYRKHAMMEVQGEVQSIITETQGEVQSIITPEMHNVEKS